MAEIAKTIIEKWSEREGYFIKFKDGLTSNCNANNLEWISFKDTFMQPYNIQRVDWDADLTKAEKRFVIENWTNWCKIYE